MFRCEHKMIMIYNGLYGVSALKLKQICVSFRGFDIKQLLLCTNIKLIKIFLLNVLKSQQSTTTFKALHLVCYLMRQGALQHTVPGDLTHVAGTELEDLCCNGVLFHQGFLWI